MLELCGYIYSNFMWYIMSSATIRYIMEPYTCSLSQMMNTGTICMLQMLKYQRKILEKCWNPARICGPIKCKNPAINRGYITP